MRLDVGTIDGNRADHPGRAGQGFENLIPDTLVAPPVKAVVDRHITVVCLIVASFMCQWFLHRGLITNPSGRGRICESPGSRSEPCVSVA